MNPIRTFVCAIFVFGFAHVPLLSAQEVSGHIGAEGRAFSSDVLHAGQKRDNASFTVQPEFYHQWAGGSSFTFAPFVRLDSHDSRRSHFDVRELNYLWLGDSWEIRVGVGKVFWGAVEFVHLVDIINQTDLVEDIDGEDKLGQPMAHLSLPRDWGVLDMFVLPYFRERTFPGRKGRLRFPLVVDTDNARYESSAEEYHVDFALRYSHTIGDWDFAIYNFNGTGREPTLLLDFNDESEPVLIPFYPQINQTGLDLQWVAGEWLFKMEALYRTGQRDDFFASIFGFEYTFVGLADTDMDLGVIGQWAFDERGDHATTPYQNDVMAGLRLALNDPADSALLAGVIQDVNSSARAVSIEASRRLGSNWRATLDAWVFLDFPEDDLSYSFRDDDFLRLELAYYF
jgi:hypothetical protein